ncbi:MAG: hypothetical protein EP322_00980 [Bacteroidetes bacterium]|nr:MAG: hypothetical protein EP322_00980 [Bacteroidota bacterium]
MLERRVEIRTFDIAMKIKFLNKVTEPKRFRYTPMYYDERKERIEERKAHYKSTEDGTLSEEDRINALRANLRSEWSRTEVRQSHFRSSNIRILILIGILLALGYFIFNGVDEVDTVVHKLW